MINSKILSQSLRTKLYFVVFALSASYMASLIYNFAMDNIIITHAVIVDYGIEKNEYGNQ